MLPRRIRTLTGPTRTPRRRSDAIRVSSRRPNGCSGPSRSRHPAVSGNVRLAGVPARAPGGAGPGERALGHRSGWALGLLRTQRRHLAVDRRAARASPRRHVPPIGPGGRAAGRRHRRDAASGHDLAVVEQGHGHRSPLRPRRYFARRTRRRLGGHAGGRRSRRRVAIPRRLGPASRSHDPECISGAHVLLGRIGPGYRTPGDIP